MSTENIKILQQLRLHLLAARKQETRWPHVPEAHNEAVVQRQDHQANNSESRDGLRDDVLGEEEGASDSEDDGPEGGNPDDIAEEIASALVHQDIQIMVEDFINPTDEEGTPSASNIADTTEAEDAI